MAGKKRCFAACTTHGVISLVPSYSHLAACMRRGCARVIKSHAHHTERRSQARADECGHQIRHHLFFSFFLSTSPPLTVPFIVQGVGKYLQMSTAAPFPHRITRMKLLRFPKESRGPARSKEKVFPSENASLKYASRKEKGKVRNKGRFRLAHHTHMHIRTTTRVESKA